MCSGHLCSAALCPATSFALVILWLRAAAVVVTAGRGWRTVASAGTTPMGCYTDTQGLIWGKNRTGTWAHVEDRSGDGTKAAA